MEERPFAVRSYSLKRSFVQSEYSSSYESSQLSMPWKQLRTVTFLLYSQPHSGEIIFGMDKQSPDLWISAATPLITLKVHYLNVVYLFSGALNYPGYYWRFIALKQRRLSAFCSFHLLRLNWYTRKRRWLVCFFSTLILLSITRLSSTQVDQSCT